MQCVNGHEVAEGQRFCPDCGVKVVVEAAASDSPAATPPTDPEREFGAKNAPSKMRSRSIIAAVAAVPFILLGVAVTLEGATDDEEDVSAPAANKGPTPMERCMDDVVALLNEHATAYNNGDQMVIHRRYGVQDPRSSELLGMYGTFQSEVIMYGQDKANGRLLANVGDYCIEYELDQ